MLLEPIAGIFAVGIVLFLPGAQVYYLVMRKITDYIEFILVSFLISVAICIALTAMLGFGPAAVQIFGGINIVSLLLSYAVINIILFLVSQRKRRSRPR
jgi:ABC-type uncharacterized transport system permease subunit